MSVLDAGRQVEHPRYQAVIFRRIRDELREIEGYADGRYLAMGAAKTGNLKDGVVYSFPSGALIELNSMEHESDWEKFKGRNFTAVYFDELVTFARVQYESIWPWVRAVDSRLVAQVRSTSNPWPAERGDGIEWIMERFSIPSGVEIGEPIITRGVGWDRVYIPATYQDNKAVDAGELDRWRMNLEQMFSPEKYNAYVRGIWGVSPGAFFYRFSRGVHGMGYEAMREAMAGKALVWAVGMDHGTGKGATTALLGAVDEDRRLYVVDQYYVTDRPLAYHVSRLVDFTSVEGRPVDVYGDRTMWNDETRLDSRTLSTANEYISRGLTRLRRAANSHEQGYRAIQDALYYDEGEEPRMVISDRCAPLLKELALAQRSPLRPDTEIKDDGRYHSIAALRYLTLALRPPVVYEQDTRVKNVVLRHVDRARARRRATEGIML